jgi:hypothetical protein
MWGVRLHGDDVAPGFRSADPFMIAERDGGRARHVRRPAVPEESWSRRLERPSAAGMKVLTRRCVATLPAVSYVS